MADPGFIPAIVGYAVSKAIEMAIQTVRHAVNCPQRCQMLAEKLAKVLPRVRTIEAQVNSGKRRYEGPVRDWLESLKAAADEANMAVQKFNSKSFWLPGVASLSVELEKLQTKIEKLVEKDLDFSLHRETHERLSRMEYDIAHIRRHSSPGSLSTSTSSNNYNIQAQASSFQPNGAPHYHSSVGSHSLNHTAQGHHDMCDSGDSHSFNYTAQGHHQPGLQRIESLDVIHHTRQEAKRREEETRRREQQQ